MDKNNSNLLLAIVFLLGFLFLWDKLVVSRFNPPPKPSNQAMLEKEVRNVLQEEKEKKTNTTVSTPMKKLAGPSYATLQTPEAEVTFERDGGFISSWKIFEKSHWLQMLMPEEKRAHSPFDFYSELSYDIEKISPTKTQLTAMTTEGLRIVKTFTLLAEPPFHRVELTLINTSPETLAVKGNWGWGSGVDKHVADAPYDSRAESTVVAEQAALAFDGQRKKWKSGFVFGRTVEWMQTGSFNWMGVGNNHFFAALVESDTPLPAVQVEGDRKHPPCITIPLTLNLAPKEQYQLVSQLYVGPKKYEDLKTYGHHLDEAVDFGFFGFISKPLLYLLNKFEDMTGNYGWAIIILTFIIQIVVFPLTIKNFKHSLRMKELQPQIKKIQEQFKSDPKRLQVETFNLYRKNGMKFMGMEGCLPMLLQIPLFFAFYSTLNVAYELRGSPWIFWIHDLAQHDPYYVLPIIMGAGMFLQQKLTAVAMDPAQARMMMFMPIMFTFMFLKLPAGLVLYWCVNSMTNIVITQFLKRQGPSPAAT